ncbi:hypothetical protein [Longimicrobium sp.]|uniref:hypothetical protein n=1 Tax=Longimicrobium sp. TaxID=2029185 RepID=UPI002E3700E7|nr:hypothetical protein [Longimicrobium sp.]HEX6040530.1 hypothetical protein [Longimicrobium sp.]
MSKARQTLLGRLTFSALVAASLTFGGAQALSGSSKVAGYTCTTQPYDPGCANYCLQQYPLNGGEHACVGLAKNCVCVQ